MNLKFKTNYSTSSSHQVIEHEVFKQIKNINQAKFSGDKQMIAKPNKNKNSGKKEIKPKVRSNQGLKEAFKIYKSLSEVTKN